MIIYQAKELVFKIDLNLIRRVEVYKEQNNNVNIDLIYYTEGVGLRKSRKLALYKLKIQIISNLLWNQKI
jgi:hypothetical protein